VASPTRLLLIRHAQSPHNLGARLVSATATGLTPLGARQGEWLAVHVAGNWRLGALYASTMDRARRTAEVVAARTGLAVRLVDDLREWDFGDCEGLTTEEIEARYPGQLTMRPARDDLTWGWPGGETRAVFYARARRAIGDLARRHPAQTVAVVSHNGLLTSFLAQTIDGVTWTHPQHDLGHCALAEVEVDDEAVRLVRRVDCVVVD
jgi:broad specificity phosphatase PhoE